MPEQRIDLPQGTLDLLILKTLALGPQHGWAISERIQQISSNVLQVQQGSLYPALHRLERRGWIGEQPSRQVLRPDAQRPETAFGGRERMAQIDGRRRPGTGNHLTMRR